jgi:Ca2+-binding EF-hand superfamily protein
LGPDLADARVWLEIIAKADADGSGEIDLEEFVQLMKNI